MENQTPPPAGGPTIPTSAQMPQAAPPMPTQGAAPIQTPPSTGGSKKLWIVLAVVILLLIFGGYYYFVASNNSSNLSATPTVIPQNTAITITPTPTATPIQNESDLNGALNQIDITTPSATTELDQNAADSTTFTQ